MTTEPIAPAFPDSSPGEAVVSDVQALEISTHAIAALAARGGDVGDAAFVRGLALEAFAAVTGREAIASQLAADPTSLGAAAGVAVTVTPAPEGFTAAAAPDPEQPHAFDPSPPAGRRCTLCRCLEDDPRHAPPA